MVVSVISRINYAPVMCGYRVVEVIEDQTEWLIYLRYGSYVDGTSINGFWMTQVNDV